MPGVLWILTNLVKLWSMQLTPVTTIRTLRKASMLSLSWAKQPLAQILPANSLSLLHKLPCTAEYVVHARCDASAQVPCIQ